MNILTNIKNFFRRGGDIVSQVISDELQSVIDHPKVALSEDEVMRIRESFRVYSGKHPQIEYLNSMRQKKKRDFQGLNMLKVASKYMANIVFNEDCEITIGEDGANEFIRQVFADNDFIENLSKYLEPMFATGGLAVRPYIDDGKVKFSWCLADTFYPLKSNTNNISECVITSRTTRTENKKQVFYTLLEFHEWESGSYVVRNELYRSADKEKVGRKVPLNTLYEDLSDEVVFEGLEKPLFSYLKNVDFNNINTRSPLGVGLADNAKSTLKRIDKVSDAFFWEINNGKRRVIVSDHFINTTVDPATGRRVEYFDDSEDMFVALPAQIDNMQWREITPEIRSEQYIASLNSFLATLEMQISVSPGTFYFDGAGVKTATEVVSENSQTFRTRSANVNAVSRFIKDIIMSVFELAVRTKGTDGKALYVGDIPTQDMIGIDFDDGIFTDKQAQLNYYSQAITAGLVPKAEVIKRLFSVDDTTAQEWLSAITAENNANNPTLQQYSAENSLLGGEE